MSQAIRVALVGCGAIVRHAHLPALLQHQDVLVDALVDPDEGARAQLRERFSLQAGGFSSLDALLGVRTPNVVIVASPGHLHGAQARAALEAGCDVLVEKPPARSTAELRELASLAEARGRKLGAVLNYRYRDLPMELARHIACGRLGTVTRIHVIHRGPLVFADAPWLWDERRSRYLVREFGIHFIDLLVWLLGPAKDLLAVTPLVHPEIGHTTDVNVTVRFEHGGIGQLDIAADSTRHSSSFTHIHVYGTGMDAFVRWFPPTVRLVSGQTTPLRLIADELRAAWSVGVKLLGGTFVEHRNVSHRRAIDAYLEWVRGGPRFPTAFGDIEPTMRLLDDIEARIPSYWPVADVPSERTSERGGG